MSRPRGIAPRGVGPDGRRSSPATRSSTSSSSSTEYADAHGHTLPELALSWLAGMPSVGERDRGRDLAGAGARQRRRHDGLGADAGGARRGRRPRTRRRLSRRRAHHRRRRDRPARPDRSPTSAARRAPGCSRRSTTWPTIRRARCSCARRRRRARRAAGADPDRAARSRRRSLAGFPAPTVAVWDGPAVGAGAEVLLAADLRVIGPDASMAFPEVGAGELPCWGGTQRLHARRGVALALRMLVVGDVVDADALERSGLAVLVDDPVAHAEALAGTARRRRATRAGRGARRGAARARPHDRRRAIASSPTSTS